MKKKMINSARVEGVLYQHNLELKLSGPNSKKPGTEFISGTIDIATNNALTNIVPVHFTYVVATTASGKSNATFETLKNIIDKKIGCYTDPDVVDKAARVRVDTSIGLNEFYSDRSGEEELVSVKRLEGGFVHVATSISENENQRNTFEVDIVIVGARDKEAVEDDSGNITSPAKVILDGRIFNFRNDMLPVTFSVVNEKAMEYFRNLEASPKNPVFTKIKGLIVSEQGVRYIKEESAFGEDSVKEIPTSNKDYVVTWAALDPYEFNLEETITFEDLKTMAQARENTLAELKQRRDDYKAAQANSNNALANTATAKPKTAATTPATPTDADYKF
jgi:hypothetical protein